MGLKLRKIRYWCLWRVCTGLSAVLLGLAKALPHALFLRVLTPIIKLLVPFLVPTRRVARNLDAAFGQIYSPATKRGLCKGVQQHFARNLIDCCRQFSDAEQVRELVTIKGIENLQVALARGKGVIALGAHIGNFVLVGTRLGIDHYPIHTLFRIPPDQKIQAAIYRNLKSFHQQIIPALPRREAVVRILEVLKRNEIVFILADNMKKGTVKTRFFDQLVCSPRGPVSLALRSEAAILPVYLIRNYEGRLELAIEPEIRMSRNGSLSTDIVQSTHRIAHYLERLIRLYPDQWNWLTVRMRKRFFFTPRPPHPI